MLRLRWRYFWSRRSATRTALALALALVALLASLYLAIPADGQRQIRDGLLAAVQDVAALGAEPLLAAIIVIGFACSLALIFVPSYRRHSYLATTPSIIPPVSVYLDAENQLSEAAIRPFTHFLIKHLDGRQADLLSFLDVSQPATLSRYKKLYHAGFRLVDVPHNPTGASIVKEAVDRELAMHAYERALLGPPGQEFIIVSGDGDFVPLVYRLVALGHRVQIWAAHIPAAYRVVKSYLHINVLDLSEVIPELKIAPQPQFNGGATLAQRSEKQLYNAVSKTIVAHTKALGKFDIDSDRKGYFRFLMHRAYGPRMAMADIGYSAGKWFEYWLEQLFVLGVLQKADGPVFPERGATTEEDAARSLFVLSAFTAKVADAIGAKHDDGLVRMKEVADALATETSPGSTVEPGAASLLKLVAAGNDRRIVYARYFVRSARALGLLQFEDVPESLDTIAHPRLTATPPSPDTTPQSPLDAPPMNDNDETI